MATAKQTQAAPRKRAGTRKEEHQNEEAPQLRPREGAAWWMLMRIVDGQRARCSVHVKGVQHERFSLNGDNKPPTLDLVRKLWGSGVYEVQWFGAENQALGKSAKLTIDDPEHPTRPLYAGAPQAAAGAASASSAPPSSGEPVAVAAARALAGENGGAVPLPMVVMLLTLGENARASEREIAQERDRRAREEHEERLARIKADAQAQIEIERERTRSRMNDVQQAQQATPDGRLAAEIAAMRAELAELREGGGDGGDDDEPGAWEQIGRAVLPMVIEHLPKIATFAVQKAAGAT